MRFKGKIQDKKERCSVLKRVAESAFHSRWEGTFLKSLDVAVSFANTTPGIVVFTVELVIVFSSTPCSADVKRCRYRILEVNCFSVLKFQKRPFPNSCVCSAQSEQRESLQITNVQYVPNMQDGMGSKIGKMVCLSV